MEQKSIREQEQSRYGFDYWEGWVRVKIRGIGFKSCLRMK